MQPDGCTSSPPFFRRGGYGLHLLLGPTYPHPDLTPHTSRPCFHPPCSSLLRVQGGADARGILVACMCCAVILEKHVSGWSVCATMWNSSPETPERPHGQAFFLHQEERGLLPSPPLVGGATVTKEDFEKLTHVIGSLPSALACRSQLRMLEDPGSGDPSI